MISEQLIQGLRRLAKGPEYPFEMDIEIVTFDAAGLYESLPPYRDDDD